MELMDMIEARVVALAKSVAELRSQRQCHFGVVSPGDERSRSDSFRRDVCSALVGDGNMVRKAHQEQGQKISLS